MFKDIYVYPSPLQSTRVIWTFSEDSTFTNGPYTLTLQMSRSGTDTWQDVATVSNWTPSTAEITDPSQRAWSPVETWFYRIKLVDASNNESYSNEETAIGSLDKHDKLVLREMLRQECLRLVKKVGSKGLLFKRRDWGPQPTNVLSATILDPDTGEVLDANNTVTYGTAFTDGYYTPFDYYVELQAGEEQKVEQTEAGTTTSIVVGAHALYYPQPKSNDFWVDCTTNVRYRIDSYKITTKIRHYPVTIALTLMELPPTDPIYKVPIL